MKHANATHVDVHLHFNCQEVELQITDDGKGFDIAIIEQNEGGSGLKNMCHRTRLFNGQLDIKSTPLSGTRLAVTIPYSV